MRQGHADLEISVFRVAQEGQGRISEEAEAV